MSVGEYQAKFEELMCFTPKLVCDDLATARCFEGGLRPSNKDKIVILKLEQYADVVGRALIVEQSTMYSKWFWESKKSRAGASNKHQNTGPFRNLQSRPPKMVRDTRTCFNCGQGGHVLNNYPQLRMYQTHATRQQ
jgi:hypothetical protein